jgi:hypothetical protein
MILQQGNTHKKNDELIDIYVGMSRNMPERPQKIEVKHAAERAER